MTKEEHWLRMSECVMTPKGRVENIVYLQQVPCPAVINQDNTTCGRESPRKINYGALYGTCNREVEQVNTRYLLGIQHWSESKVTGRNRREI